MSRARGRSSATAGRSAGLAALDAKWEAVAAEAFLGIKDWRVQHPTATFAEIEMAVGERLSLVRARMLADVALTSVATTVSDTPVEARPACPVCTARGTRKGQLEARGQQAREVTVTDFGGRQRSGTRAEPSKARVLPIM